MEILIEDTKEVNIAITEDPKIIFFVTSLTKEEKLKFQKFFIERKISFAWSYVDMPRLDEKLVLHHLLLLLDSKPIK